ncbi:sensor histidine kinase [Streptomyces sp. NPDC019890]|uniref:sensor histidine kinase n=1 Tax=Streptomyces sp. NPDC019890 TaxID=3365064 RepID=UPI00384D0069
MVSVDRSKERVLPVEPPSGETESLPFAVDVAMAPRIALVLFSMATFGMLGSATLHLLLTDQGLWQIIVGGGALAVVFAAQFVRSTQGGMRLRRRSQYWLLVIQAVCVYIPMVLLGEAWIGLPGFLAASLLLTFRPPWSWLSAGLVWVSVVIGTASFGMKPLDIAYYGVSIATTSIVVYGLTLLTEMVTQLRSAQREIARLAVERERLRFARDLHDLLGYSLSAITLRSELTLRLIDQHPSRAKDELSTVLEISRQALADTRAVARSYRHMSFPAELESARSVFDAAGIDIEVESTLTTLPDQAGTVLATVLREGITNILRHSSVRRCRITARETAERAAVLHVVNDGVDRNAEQPNPYEGSGIGNLSARVSALGGGLSAGVRADGCFHLLARVPLEAGGDDRDRPVQPLRVVPGLAESPSEDGTRSAV